MLARLRNLFRNLAIYGAGDVAMSIVSLLLLPVYTRYLSPSDYGIIAMLLTIEAVAKILFRWGVDTAFMRMFYDCADAPARQRLASTIFFFLLAGNGVLVLAGVASAGWLSATLFDTPAHALLIRLVILNTFVVGFYFIPFQVMRIGERSAQFISLVFARSASTLLMRLVLVIGAGMGVLGVVVADLLVTAVFTVVLSRWFAPLIRPVFSRPLMREALGFGLPRIPHSLSQQVIGVADRYFLNAFGTLRDVGLYSIGASFGLALKLFLSAFEYAWTPFFLGAMREPDAKRIYSTVSTYVLAVLVLLTAALCAVAPDIIALTTTAAFHQAAAVTPWIALGVMCQGVYLVGSIGLIITRRTTRYPLATGIAAATSLAANTLLIPRFGLMGAAWANTIASWHAGGRHRRLFVARVPDTVRVGPPAPGGGGGEPRVRRGKPRRAGVASARVRPGRAPRRHPRGLCAGTAAHGLLPPGRAQGPAGHPPARDPQRSAAAGRAAGRDGRRDRRHGPEDTFVGQA